MLKVEDTSGRERRKQVRPRLRPDLQIVPQVFNGQTTYAIKDPVALRHYALTEREHFLAGLMDGQHTLDAIQKAFEERFRPERMTLEKLEAFAQDMIQKGLATADVPHAGRHLFERRRKRLLGEWAQVLTNVLFIKIRLFDPDRFLARIGPWLGWMFAPWTMAIGTCVVLSALMFVMLHLTAFRAKLPEAQEFFSWKMAGMFWVAVSIVKILHELGHGLACKTQGGEVHEAGLLLLCLSPSLYCDVTDAWKLPGRWRRVVIGLAGIYVELLIAAMATFVWWNAPGDAFLNRLCLSLMVVCSISTVLFNANPLLRFDGYYVLAELIGVPDLRERADRHFKGMVLEHTLGAQPAPEPYTPPSRKLLFGVYAVASFIYGWTVAFGMLWFLYHFLKPYKLGTLGMLLSLAAFGLLVGQPLFRLGQYLHRRGWQIPEMTFRAKITVTVGVLLVLAFFTLPLPISRVSESGLVQVEPESVRRVFVTVPGILTRLHVRDGQRVEAGDVLAEFTSLEVDRQREEAQSEHDIRSVQEQVIRTQALATADPQKRAKLDVERAAAAGERKQFAAQVEVYEEMQQRLVLRAPLAGVVMIPPGKDDIGKLYDKDQTTPFCSVGLPNRLQVLLPVTPADYRLLDEDLDRDVGLAAIVRVRGRLSVMWEGRVGSLPESEAKEVPFGLTQKGGGPLAVKASGQQGTHVPQEQHYLVAVDVKAADAGLRPGNQAQVKVWCRWRTAAWWAWRKVAGLFDLG